MDRESKQAFIRRQALGRRIKWSSHALGEMIPEGLSVGEVEVALQSGEVIEDYAHAHRYLPDCLVLMYRTKDEPIHAVVAINEPREYILMVTVYHPNTQEWQNDWRTRK